MNRGRPEGVTRLAMCMIEGRAGWSGVEPQAQETGHGPAYTIYRHGRTQGYDRRRGHRRG